MNAIRGEVALVKLVQCRRGNANYICHLLRIVVADKIHLENFRACVLRDPPQKALPRPIKEGPPTHTLKRVTHDLTVPVVPITTWAVILCFMRDAPCKREGVEK